MSFYDVKVVSRTGTVHATLANATAETVTWALNEPGSATFRVPVHDSQAPEVQPLKREVQVWRNGVLLDWFVPAQRDYDASNHAVQWTCPGVLWYFTRRVFGPISVNYLTNPNFATDLTGWTAVGCTATRSTAIRLRGPGTAKLVATASGDKYLQHTFSVTTGGVGLYLAFAGLYWIDTADPYVVPALEERGLYISAPGSLPDGSPSWEPITMNAPAGQAQRVETGISLPASTTLTVTVRLYVGDGTIHWGGLSVTALESVSSEAAGTDVTEMMRRIVDYAQNGTGKSSVSIVTSTPAAGTTEILAYQFADLGNVFDALKTYPARGLADFAIVSTATTKTFTTYAPRKGSFKSGSGLTVPGASVLALGHQLDGQQTATKTIRRGAGDGSDRELGVATDAAALDGLILEDVADAPPEVTVDGLDGLASTDLARLKDLVALPDFTVPAEGWIGVVQVGDTVPVTINWGDVQDTTTRRVVAMTLDCVSDTVRVGVNVA